MIHRTGKRASHKSKEYSVAIKDTETDDREESTKDMESNDHAVSVLYILSVQL